MRRCAAALLVALAAAERSDIPSVRTLGAQWEVMPLRAMPLIVNFVGGVNLQRSVVGLGPLTLALEADAPPPGGASSLQDYGSPETGAASRGCDGRVRWRPVFYHTT